MIRFLRCCWKYLSQAFSLSCLALALGLPGVGPLSALAWAASLPRAERPEGRGCIGCDLSALGCDAGRPHWIHVLAGPGADRCQRGWLASTPPRAAAGSPPLDPARSCATSTGSPRPAGGDAEWSADTENPDHEW